MSNTLKYGRYAGQMTLDEYLVETGIVANRIASKVEITSGYLSEIRHGQRTPPLELALKIAEACEGKVALKSLIGQNTRPRYKGEK